MPLSTASEAGESIFPWTKLPVQYITAAGIVTAVINNNDSDLTKHAWGLKGLIFNTEHLHAIVEWQHAGLVHVPPRASVRAAPPPMAV